MPRGQEIKSCAGTLCPPPRGNRVKKEGASEKGCVDKDWDFSVHFVLEFQENSIYTLYLCLAKMLKNGTKFIQELIPGFKNHMRNLDNFRQAVENPKTWNVMG